MPIVAAGMNRFSGVAVTLGTAAVPSVLAPGAGITVFQAGGVVPITLYAKSDGSQPLANPFVADVNGRFNFYCMAQRVDVRIAPVGFAAYTAGDAMELPQAPALPFANFPPPTPTDAGSLVFRTDATKGLYVDTGTAWQSVGGTGGNVVFVGDYGAVGNGIADDTVPIKNAIAALIALGGGILRFGAGLVYKTTGRINIQGNNILIDGQGAIVKFTSGNPGVDDRAFAIFGAVTTFRPIVGAVALGANSFVAANPGDTADLVPGDWLVMQEVDANVATPVFTDWVQVRLIAGLTVNLYAPMRTAFPATHGTVQFCRVTSLVTNNVMRDLTVQSFDAAHILPALTVGIAARGTVLDSCVFQSLGGPALTSFLTADLKVDNCQVIDGGAATEFASSVDLMLFANTFQSQSEVPITSALTVDYGTAFFSVIGNSLIAPANIAFQMTFGCHDGAVIGNTIGYVHDAGIVNTVGIAASGGQRITYIGNVLVGGDGGAGVGIAVADSSTLAPNIVSQGNWIALNPVNGFAIPYAVANTTDVVLMQLTNGAFQVQNPVVIGTGIPIPTKGLNFRAATYTPNQIHWEKIASNNWYCGPDDIPEFFVGFNVDTDRAWKVSSVGLFTAKAGIKASAGSSSINAWFTGDRAGVTAATYSANPIPGNTVATFTIPVVGALGGDLVVATPDQGLGAALVWTAYVSANDVVTVVVANPTVGALAQVPTVHWRAACLRTFPP